jgi:cell division ATPase FtsA
MVIYQRTLPDAALGILVRAVEDEFEFGEPEAVHVLRNIGLDAGSPSNLADPAHAHVQVQPQARRRVRELVEQHIEQTIAEVEAALQYASHRYPHIPVKRLLISGGGSTVRGICEHLSARLKLVEARVLSPARIVRCPQELAGKCTDGMLTIALGLASYGHWREGGDR